MKSSRRFILRRALSRNLNRPPFLLTFRLPGFWNLGAPENREAAQPQCLSPFSKVFDNKGQSDPLADPGSDSPAGTSLSGKPMAFRRLGRVRFKSPHPTGPTNRASHRQRSVNPSLNQELTWSMLPSRARPVPTCFFRGSTIAAKFLHRIAIRRPRVPGSDIAGGRKLKSAPISQFSRFSRRAQESLRQSALEVSSAKRFKWSLSIAYPLQ
jgi:hypothetical protein